MSSKKKLEFISSQVAPTCHTVLHNSGKIDK